MPYRVLAVASEWFPFHGGLSTFNQAFCAALAAAGHEVVCLVPRADKAELFDATRVGVKLVCPDPVPGLSDEAILCLAVDLGIEPDLVLGHGHITGGAAAARVRQFHPKARRIHFLHTLPELIEPYKLREDEDPADRAERKQKPQAELATTADLAVAVGPLLYQHWETYLNAVRPGIAVHRLTPGLPDLPAVPKPPASSWCLLMGRLEDAELKGVNLASKALGILKSDPHFKGPNEITLILRGTEPGKSHAVRKYVHEHARCEIQCIPRPYSHRAEDIRHDIASSSLLLMPSQSEGFGLVGLEALAQGVPILVSQRSGLAHLLHELSESDPKLLFARDFIVEGGESLEKDAERWATAISKVLKDRPKAFKDAVALREVFRNANYWRRAVDELLNALSLPVLSSDAPPDTPGTQFQQAQQALDVDLRLAIIRSASPLERVVEQVATSRGLATPGLPTMKYISTLEKAGLLTPNAANKAAKLLHLRNVAAHSAEISVTKEEVAELIDEANGILIGLTNSVEKADTDASQPKTATVPQQAHSAELKREADLKQLKRIYALFPRPIVAEMLNEAARDRIEVFHTDVIDTAEDITRSTIFHLYDKKLWELLKAFFAHWNAVWELGVHTHDDPSHTGIFTAMSELHTAFDYSTHAQYHEAVRQAQQALFDLNRYVRDNYPELDLEQSDKDASDKYWEFCNRFREGIEQLRVRVERGTS